MNSELQKHRVKFGKEKKKLDNSKNCLLQRKYLEF